MFSQHQSRKHWYCSALFRGVCWAAATSPAATLTTEFTTTNSKHSHLDRLQNQIQRGASWLGSLQCVLPQEKSWCFTLLLHLKEWKFAPHKSILNLSQNTSVIMLVHSLGPVMRKRIQLMGIQNLPWKLQTEKFYWEHHFRHHIAQLLSWTYTWWKTWQICFLSATHLKLMKSQWRTVFVSVWEKSTAGIYGL